jgi:hypothetical protein
MRRRRIQKEFILYTQQNIARAEQNIARVMGQCKLVSGIWNFVFDTTGKKA